MIVLASASPRRRELLAAAGFDFDIIPAKGEEIMTETDPDKAVMALAAQKAREISAVRPGDTVIGADTIVFCAGEFLGKPKDAEDAKRMLRLLSGRTHSVYTGVCVIRGGTETAFADKTEVEFYPLSESEIESYVDSSEPFDKAGAYGIQGRGCVLVKGITGDYYNVMGLPVARVFRVLTAK